MWVSFCFSRVVVGEGEKTRRFGEVGGGLSFFFLWPRRVSSLAPASPFLPRPLINRVKVKVKPLNKVKIKKKTKQSASESRDSERVKVKVKELVASQLLSHVTPDFGEFPGTARRNHKVICESRSEWTRSTWT